jgi:branched-chain amino acid transport system ATP-binding protein
MAHTSPMQQRETAMSEPLIHVDEVIAGYVPGVNILNGCTLELAEGELIGIIGPNGAGKSTMLKALFGLLSRSPTARSGIAARTSPARRRHFLVARGIGYVPQINNVFPSLTIRENLEMGGYLRKSGVAEMIDTVVDIFPRLGERIDQRAGSLSGGERQMLAMGRALMMEPSVLLLDEPSAGLSPVLQDQVFDRVKQVNSTGVSIIMVEQNAARCLSICGRGYVLDQGRNAYTGTGEELLKDPKVIELYLGTLAKAR